MPGPVVPEDGCERRRMTGARRSSLIAFLVAGLLGALYARWLYGSRALDPASVQWLLHGDAAQHFIGLSFFLSEPWRWPPGAMLGFGAGPTSVVFTDSIPLLALAAKAAGFPPGAQYFGAWMLACHALLGAFGALLLRRLGASLGAAVVGAMFFASAPVVLMRAYGHEALMGQFVVVAALAVAHGRWSAPAWAALLAASTLVHPYLAAMVFAIALAATADALQRRTLRAGALMRRVPALLGAPALAAWLAGYFVGDGERSAGGHDFFSANALTWFDPMDWSSFSRHFDRDPTAGEWSALLPSLGQATVGQYEGFAYLGAGAIAIVAAALLMSAAARFAARLPSAVSRFADSTADSTAGRAMRRSRSLAQPVAETRRRPLWILAACAALALVALSTRPSVGPRILFAVPTGPTVEYLLGIFRASGRFVWPLTWLVLAWATARVARVPRSTLLLAGLLVLQAIDLAPKHAELRDRFRTGPPGIQAQPLAPVWQTALRVCPRLHWLGDPAQGERWITPALAVVRAGARLDDAPTARRSPTEAAAHARALEALRGGDGWREDTVYVDLRQGDAAADAGTAEGFPGAPAAFRTVAADGFVLLAAPRCLSGASD